MIQSDALKLDGLSHGFFTRRGGFSTGIFSSLNCGLGSGDDRDVVLQNRALVAQTLGVDPGKLLSAYQVHSPDAVVVTGPWPTQDRPRVDALVTKTPGVALGVLTADCGPLLFADARARVIGAAHAGWKGALTGVTTRTLETMESEGAKRENIVAVMGPMISRAAYEVGPEFPSRFIDADPSNQRFFDTSCSTCRAISRPASDRKALAASSTCRSAHSATRSASSAIAARPIAMRKTTDG